MTSCAIAFRNLWMYWISLLLAVGVFNADGSMTIPASIIDSWLTYLRGSKVSPIEVGNSYTNFLEAMPFEEDLFLRSFAIDMSTTDTNPNEEAAPKTVAELYEQMHALIEAFKASKPNDRSPNDRFWALTITHLENAESTFWARIWAK